MTDRTGRIKVVIGDRLGNGHNVAAGVTEAGGEAILIPGPGADMKIGDIMNREGADLGISFCGSGGAGAITAKVKYGYDVEFGLRTIEAGVTAIRAGKRIVGFGFLDQHDLGYRITREYLLLHGGDA
ncbi:SFCGS family glycine-rich protein [Nocardiopsis mangrovi]|uniref:SFCGS family glycine-rich protein n=1 Tax=Nocardiopsis mangrovi TaxID=1179818 RepID=A0ABV9DZ67_9ACTN